MRIYTFILILMLLFISCKQRIQISEIKKEENASHTQKDDVYLLDGKAFTGVLYELYDNENLEVEFHTKDGKRFGSYRYWCENGQLNDEGYNKSYKIILTIIHHQ